MNLERALEIAREAHAGQVDKAGRPYIEHVERVVAAVDSEDAKIVAALHDVAEDCPDWPHMRIYREGLSWRLVQEVAVITHYGEISYADYIQEVSRRPIARVVKIADLHDNLRPDRGGNITSSHAERYRRALSVLEDAEARRQVAAKTEEG